MNIKISFAARSHTGRVRSNNEDNLYCGGRVITPEARDVPFSLRGSARAPCVFAVCDGMGGEDDGEVASLAAASVLKEHAEKIARAASQGKTDAAVREFVFSANGKLCGIMSESGRSVRMGTTLAMIVVTGEEVWPYNIGDSRIYALRGGRLSRLSQDHTLAAQKVRMGVLTEEQAENSREKNMLTRFLGVFEDEMTAEAYSPGPLPRGTGAGSRVLLCSDGLTDMVAERRIEEILNDAADPWEAAGRLEALALANGGRDNVTCVVADI